ncbi:MAG: glycosyltransferase family 39 protein [Pyrinomonadaceae bacterium]|nr:glycosyltransferase family 39 protein [Pyrinomonadaceae bacterium]
MDKGLKKSFVQNLVGLKWLNGKVVSTVLVTKLLLFFYGLQAYQIVTDQPIAGFYTYLNFWKRWDAENYLIIAQNGYAAIGEQRFLIVFFPLYPALIAFVNLIVGDVLISAFLVTAFASIALGLLFRELVKMDFGEKTAQNAVLFLFIFPTSYFLHIPYTESLFLALTVGGFLAARKRAWIVVGILSFLACLTRINGLILFPALAFEIWNEYRETKKLNLKWLFLIMVPVGFGAYLALNYFVAGDATMFLTYQNEHWRKSLTFPWRGIVETAKIAVSQTPNNAQMTGIQELFFAGIGIFATLAGWAYLRNSYRVWMLLNWLLFVSTNFILSVPRYTLVMFPLFILMALAGRRSWWANALFITWSILYLALFSMQFVRGWWAF